MTAIPGKRLVFPVSFAALLALLLIRSHELFSRVIYEEGDLAANSIITYQAKHFELLVGNYSRIGFSHPGPAYFYLQAAGEWLLHDLLHLVPSPWNGQAVAILALNAACLALVLTIVHDWFRSWVAVAAAGGAALAYLAGEGDLVTSTWMPLAYFAPFLLLLVAGASVAAGRLGQLWMLVLAGCLLVHGHAEFLFFVPLIAGAALLLCGRRRPASIHRSEWLPALAVLAVFLLPMVLNLVLHWPGEFGRYLSYGGERSVHPPLDGLRYELAFWADNQILAAAVVVILFTAGWLLARLSRPEEYSRLLLAGCRMAGLAAVLFLVYACYGVDDLREEYIGYFSQAIPLALLMLAAAGTVALLPRAVRGAVLLPRVVAAAVLVAGLVAAALSGQLVNHRLEVPGTPHALDEMSARADGRPIVLDLVAHDAWPEATPLVIEGIRRGERVCLSDSQWRVLVTPEYVCTADDLSRGARFVVSRPPYTPAHGTTIADLHPAVVSLPAPQPAS